MKKFNCENGCEWVDLGLPSGLKWATCNIGATKPEESGDYFAWGETSPKRMYSWDNYIDYVEDFEGGDTFIKYNLNGGKIYLDFKDDAATINMGGKWRIPIKEEWSELQENCVWIWIIQNGVKGYKVIGRNGNSIFLPAVGIIDSLGCTSEEYFGSYWSSLLNEDSSTAVAFDFSLKDVGFAIIERYVGLSIRGVCE